MTYTNQGISIRVVQDPKDEGYFKVFCPCCRTQIGAVWRSLNGWGANLWNLASAEMAAKEDALDWICKKIGEARVEEGEEMTPEQFLTEQRAIESQYRSALKLLNRRKPRLPKMSELRLCQAKDLRIGTIIYYAPDQEWSDEAGAMVDIDPKVDSFMVVAEVYKKYFRGVDRVPGNDGWEPDGFMADGCVYKLRPGDKSFYVRREDSQ